MPIDISARFAFTLDQPGDVLLQFEAAHIPEQPVLTAHTQLPQDMHFARVFAQNDIGERIWMHGQGDFEIGYKASVDVRRQVGDIATLARLDTHDLPGEAVEYLFDSIYCPASRMQSFAIERFGELEGGAKIAAMVMENAGEVAGQAIGDMMQGFGEGLGKAVNGFLKGIGGTKTEVSGAKETSSEDTKEQMRDLGRGFGKAMKQMAEGAEAIAEGIEEELEKSE